MALDELLFVVKTISTDFVYGSSDTRRLYIATTGFTIMTLICLLSFYYTEFTLAFLIIAIWVFF